MRKIFGFLFIGLIVFFQICVGNALASPALEGKTQRCDPDDGCPYVIVPFARVTVQADADTNGTYESEYIDVSGPGGVYYFLAIPISVPCRIKAEKSDIGWETPWFYFTSASRGEILYLNTSPNSYQCQCK